MPQAEAPTYKMGIVMCMGTEHVHVEKVAQGHNDGHPNQGFGALANQPIGGACWALTKAFLREYAWKKNEDGSYLDEGQLRQLWKDFAVPRYCGSPEGRCHGCCAALPGDTVYWKLTDWGYPESYKYEPATQEELEERGWLQMGPGGLLVAQARLARDDPAQLEESDEEE